MAEYDKTRVDALLSQIERAAGELPERSGVNGQLIAEIIQSVNGLRSVLDVVRPH
jgi:hypothetical protein